MAVRKTDIPIPFSPNDPTRLTLMGDITDVVVSKWVNREPVCRRISRDCYLNTRTDEVGEYSHIKNRAQCGDSLRKTLRHIRELINTNVTDYRCVRWITLTYRENMTDRERLYHDFEKFWKRFRYYCGKQGFANPEYISVVEPQGRGAWHIHALFIWADTAPFIPNEELRELWGWGFVSIKEPKDCDNLGAYFSGYLADLPEEELLGLDDEEQVKARAMAAIQGSTEAVELQTAAGQSKKIVKGARMALYPPGMNIYRTSRGIKRPEVIRTDYYAAERYLRGSRLTYEQSYDVLDESGHTVNCLWKASYNARPPPDNNSSKE